MIDGAKRPREALAHKEVGMDRGLGEFIGAAQESDFGGDYSEVDEEENLVSLEMFSQELDSIHLSRGMIENIWYVELERRGKAVWSSVITCDFFQEKKGRGWVGIGSRVQWEKKRMFGEETNVITRRELQELLAEDGIKEKTSLGLFVSVGLWKSLFLTLNYSAYILRKRENLYSSQVREYVTKFNCRKETIERRMNTSSNETERMNMVKLIYQGIQDVFGSETSLEGEHLNGDFLRVGYKTPFYWGSSLAILYILERLGNIDLLLLMMEYISEVQPELIFAFGDQFGGGPMDQEKEHMVNRLNIFNNELLQSLSTCYLEYLSDLLSITKRSTLILSSYASQLESSRSPEKSKVQDSNGSDCENLAKTNSQDSLRKRPNYMRPTRLSELRRQHSRKNQNQNQNQNQSQKQNQNQDQGQNQSQGQTLERSRNLGYDQCQIQGAKPSEEADSSGYEGPSPGDSVARERNLEPVSSRRKERLGAVADSLNVSHAGSLEERNLRVDENCAKVTQGEVLEEIQEVQTDHKTRIFVERNKSKVEKNRDREPEIAPEEQNNLGKILSILEEKSRCKAAGKVSFDDELFNIINEIDKITFDGAGMVKDTSTNISDDFSQNNLDSNYTLGSDGMDPGGLEEDQGTLESGLDSSLDGGNYLRGTGRSFEEAFEYGEPKTQVIQGGGWEEGGGPIKPHLDPYDWYCMSNGNDGIGQESEVRAGGSREVPEEVVLGDERGANLINLTEGAPMMGFLRNETSGNSLIGETEDQKEKRPLDGGKYNELKYIESILDKEIEELQKQESELASNIYF
ncbi:asparagine-rich protein, possible [Cryptosporidium felis]|nr:asparagine-rich protein, possible [Cryptosporidium felis]